MFRIEHFENNKTLCILPHLDIHELNLPKKCGGEEEYVSFDKEIGVCKCKVRDLEQICDADCRNRFATCYMNVYSSVFQNIFLSKALINESK